MKKQITAKLYPKNLRDIHTSSPRVLLKELNGIDREYVWCNDKKLLTFIDRNKINSPIYIQFMANTYNYTNSRLQNKLGVNKLSHIKTVN
jgi:hypothetical protein